jgi:YVTN family beta-propeller protein
MPNIGWLMLGVIAGLWSFSVSAADTAPLILERKIPLGEVSGRIDHFALDSEGQRLFVAELGNNTVGIIDLRTNTITQRLGGLKEPQGVGYFPETASLFAANAGDGAVQVFKGTPLLPAGKIELKDDADNVRIMPGSQDVVVGFGSGALAVIDGKTLQRKADIKLKAHPESFQIDPVRRRAYINVPDAHEVAVVDLAVGRQIASWDQLPARSNFPMALINEGKRLAVVFRSPGLLAVFDTDSGGVIAQSPTCGDADDVFFDAHRSRFYVACGEGKIGVYDFGTSLKPVAQIETASGARTAFFDADAARLFLAVRASASRAAEVWVFRLSD